MKNQAGNPGQQPSSTDRSAFRAFYTEKGHSDRPIFFVCDHASNACPPAFPQMNLADPSLMDDHIGWDIGAAAVTEQLATDYDVTAVYAGFTRLYIDPNRMLDDPSMIPAVSDGVVIPPNQQVSDADRDTRLNTLFRPYHDEIASQLDAVLRQGIVPLVVSIHSFTPSMDGFDRPWHAGVLWARDPRIKTAAMEWFDGQDDIVAGENEPYSAITGPGYTMDVHCLARGLPHLLLEIRQDLINDEKGQADWAEKCRQLIDHLVAKPEIMQICRF